MRHHIAIAETIPPVCLTDFDKVQKHSNALPPAHKPSRIDSFLDFDDYLAEQCKDPEYKKRFERGMLIIDIAYMVASTRKKLGLTQAELAAKAQTTQPVIARLEGGRSRRMPSLDLLAKIANAMGMELKIGLGKG